MSDKTHDEIHDTDEIENPVGLGETSGGGVPPAPLDPTDPTGGETSGGGKTPPPPPPDNP